MKNSILIAYASKKGSTKEIAQAICSSLKDMNIEADIKDISQIADINDYDTLILGSSVYYGMWQKSFVKFLLKNKDTLCQKFVWLFSSGPTGEEKPLDITKGWLVPAKQKELIGYIKPVEIKLFHGKLDLKCLNVFEKLIIKKVDAPFGDYRVWDSITSWASSIGKYILNK